MALGIRDFSTTASNNTDIAGINQNEGMSRPSVNNAMRARDAETAKLLLDLGGATATTGSANAYLLSLPTAPLVYGDNLLFAATANHTNSAAATINVNGRGLKNIKKMVAGVATDLASGDYPAGHIGLFTYSSANNAVILLFTGQVTLSAVSGTLAIANGGTGQTSASAAFQALSPMTTRGDLIRGGASGPERVALGTTGQVLVSDGTDAIWATLALTTAQFAANVVDTDVALTANADDRIASQKATKAYVDAASAGINWAVGGAVAVASTANLTLSGEQTIDGVLTSASRILVKNQTTATQNGIYVTAAGAWARSTDADAGAEFIRLGVFVSAGTTQLGTTWVCTRTTAPTLGVDNLAFVQNGASAVYTAGTGLGLSGNAFSITDAELLAFLGLTSAADRLPYFTGSGTASLATFTATGRLVVAGATTTAIATTLGLGASDSPQFTGVNIGTATDTTITRVSSGKIAVEGDTVAMLGAVNAFTGANTFSTATQTITKTAAGSAATQLALVNSSINAGTEVVIDFAPNTSGVGARSAQIASQNVGGSTEANLVFRVANGTTPQNALKIDLNGLVRLFAYGAGMLVTDGSGNITAKSGITDILTGTATYNPPSLENSSSTTTVTVTGAALGDVVLASFSLDLQGILLNAYVSSANTCTAVFFNHTGTPIDLSSGTLKCVVFK